MAPSKSCPQRMISKSQTRYQPYNSGREQDEQRASPGMPGSQAFSKQPACANARTDGVFSAMPCVPYFVTLTQLYALCDFLQMIPTQHAFQSKFPVHSAGLRVLRGALWASIS